MCRRGFNARLSPPHTIATFEEMAPFSPYITSLTCNLPPCKKRRSGDASKRHGGGRRNNNTKKGRGDDLLRQASPLSPLPCLARE